MGERDGIFRAVGCTYSTPMVANRPFNEAKPGKLEGTPRYGILLEYKNFTFSINVQYCWIPMLDC